MSTNFTLKNIPQDLFEKVRARAGRNHRSINGEIIAILDRATAPRRVEPADILARAGELRERMGSFLIDEAFIGRAKREGRP